MVVVEINPAYRDLLERHGLADAKWLAALPGVIICGHPRRHVRRVTLDFGSETIHCFLKLEHRVSWRQRLANAWNGCGFVSDSMREGKMLQALRRAGVGCPEWIAAGENDHGQAFLLVRAVNDALDLPSVLRHRRDSPSRWRRCLARKLGATLANLHDAGFQHRDLYAKHILVGPPDTTVSIIDWQRGRWRPFIAWPQRWHDLAALQATLPDSLADRRDRLAFMGAYLKATLPIRVSRAFRRDAIEQIQLQSHQLLQRRKVREQRQTTLAIGTQQLIALDGEALCVTPEFYAELGGLDSFDTSPKRKQGNLTGRPSPLLALRACVASKIRALCGYDQPGTYTAHAPVRQAIEIPGGNPAILVRRRSMEPFRWLWAWLRDKPLVSSELRLAGLLFRLQRHGIGTPRLLAVGQRHPRPWQIESFLLTEPLADTVGLTEWLANNAGAIQRRHVARAAGGFLRRFHQAGCFLGLTSEKMGERLAVQVPIGPTVTVVLAHIDGIVASKPHSRRALRDIVGLWESLAGAGTSRTDRVRFVQSYLNRSRLGSEGRRLAVKLLALAKRDGTPIRERAARSMVLDASVHAGEGNAL